MRIDELMRKEVFTCRENDPLTKPAQLMWEHDCGTIPVVDDDGRLVGMITDRDICMAAFTQGKRIEEIGVGAVMARTPKTCRPGDSVADVERVMRSSRVRRVPIVQDGGRVAGIVSINDLALEASRERGNGSGKGHPRVTVTEVMETFASICEHQGPSAHHA